MCGEVSFWFGLKMLLWKNRWGISVAAAASKFSSRPKRLVIQSRRRDGSMDFKWIWSSKNQKSKSPPASTIPICISTHQSDIDIQELSDLYGSCNHSCHRLSGRVEEVMDLNKLRIALTHSSVVLSVFCNPNQVVGDLGFLERLVPLTPNSGQLVGFGRAVSDVGLTASIYDVMVSPSHRGLGIGRLIVERIVRILTGRGIYDIAALCSEQESLFFKSCGFGDDILGATTMMYTTNKPQKER